jgi:hypothetical protein
MEPEEGNERARGKYRMPDLRGKGFRGLFDSGKYLPGLAGLLAGLRGEPRAGFEPR